MKQIYTIHLKERLALSLSAQHIPLRPARRLHFFFGASWRQPWGVPHNHQWNEQGGDLLNGGFLTLAIWALRRQDREVGQVRLHPNRTTAS